MFPGGMNPKNMQRIMKQMGIKSDELEVKKVIFEMNSKKLVIENPQVTAVEMSGQKTYTVMGEAKEETNETEIPEEDIAMVAETTGKTKKEAENALKESNGDIAEAIENLKK
ncbi:MAG: nascent polypeptide-associated complex protein [Candidatus Diapherotrites archaeon]|nr:nascent polypeptide-associated complex protein [Candidatus Diapherotrites archaeon]